MDQFNEIHQGIMADPANAAFTAQGIAPLYHVTADATIIIISQAPSRKAQESMVFWNDPSGDRLRDWMGVSKDEFYNSGKIAVMPIDFYYPGKGKSGDLPPRKGFAEKWHAPLLAGMPKLQLKLLIGAYAIKYYLGADREKTLTATVHNFDHYLPEYFPLVHPSPLNYGWLHRNDWFASDVLPVLKAQVRQALN
ncbi:uracil-DNA glycosylase family protein [Lacticaseibacillus pabuli]|uniref:Uracil-DNA glycosylase family protein n=1 Tax=Lacticaseibacillus pabuli TaxID=3025672 RepID=A0ABY7WS32_9LACO|nr:uracil-DNA glycosylase family protein [Lacticaseibacillus sp. KACC 23028]WDF82977.1 uracil-DNA glycosylase family protein [Lacticaseibacillus sp. KACC 23028]